MLFPLLYLAVSLAAGIYLASLSAAPLIVPIIALLVSLAAAWLAYRQGKDRLALGFALASTLFIGWGLYAWEDFRYERNPVRAFVHDGYTHFTGRVCRAG